jgi:hypothetical protein
VWVRSVAIRPVAPFAQLPLEVLRDVEAWLCADDSPGDEYLADDDLAGDQLAERRLGEFFERFEEEQPVLAAHVGEVLSRTGDDLATALGYFLAIVLWMAFEREYDGRLETIDALAVDGVAQSLALDEELRRADPAEMLETEDVIALEQPHATSFIHEHIETALEAHAATIDVDAVQKVYRVVLEQLLVLSYSVRHPDGDVLPAEALNETREIYA